MLNALRKAAGSWIAKLLFGLLVISFAIWGIGDIFRRGGGADVVAEVGDHAIGAQAFLTEFQRAMDQMRPLFGGKLDVAQARQLGVADSVLQRMIAQAVFDEAAREMGLAISDAVVREAIETDPAFKGPGGAFDKFQFQQVLLRAGFTEATYAEAVRRNIAREELTRAIKAAGHAPKILVEAVYRMNEEKRVADMVEVASESFTDIPAPGEAALAAYHQEHAELFMAPEYRALSYLTLTPANVAGGIEISEQELRQAYDDNQNRFTSPERRHVLQIVAVDEETAERAEAALAEGKDFTAVAKDIAGQEPDAVDLGVITADALAAELRDPVFALAEGAATQPIETALGWHILKVTEIEPAKTTSFEEASKGLRDEIARDRAYDTLYDLGNQLEDSLAGGASLEEAGRKLGLQVATLAAVDSEGRDQNDRKIEGLPEAGFLNLAFATPEGQTSALTELPDGGYVLLRVDKVTPAALRPLESVRDIVAVGWKAAEQKKAAKARAAEILEKVKGGRNLADAARDFGLDPRTTPPFRRGDESPLPADVAAAVFQGAPGAAAMGESPDGFAVGQLKEVVAADPASDKDGVAATARGLDDAIGTDLVVQYATALEHRYKVQIHEKTLDKLLSSP